MPHVFSQLFFDHDKETLNENSFWNDRELSLFSLHQVENSQILDSLVFKVRRDPGNLLSHLRRIYFCYVNRLSDQLYAALLDLLIVLQGKGKSIGRRMIDGCRHQLSEQQLFVLTTERFSDLEQHVNPYCLFTSGRQGQGELVEFQRQTDRQYDVLSLANDFIEFSQLDQAMDVLEDGVIANPERQDLQEALLQLYKSTRNRERFINFFQKINVLSMRISDDWRLAAKFLKVDHDQK